MSLPTSGVSFRPSPLPCSAALWFDQHHEGSRACVVSCARCLWRCDLDGSHDNYAHAPTDHERCGISKYDDRYERRVCVDAADHDGADNDDDDDHNNDDRADFPSGRGAPAGGFGRGGF